MPEFLEVFSDVKIFLFAIDEVYCMSQWGYNFRTVYTELFFLAEKFSNTSRVAIIATADELTRKDVFEKLNLKNTKAFISVFDRPNIHYSIVVADNSKKQLGLLHYLFIYLHYKTTKYEGLFFFGNSCQNNIFCFDP